MTTNKKVVLFPEILNGCDGKIYIQDGDKKIKSDPPFNNSSQFLDSLDSFLSKSQANHVLAMYALPEFEIAHLIGERNFHEGSLKEILDRFERFLAIVRRYPQNILLIDYEKAERSPDIVAEELSSRSWGRIHGFGEGANTPAASDLASSLARLAVLENPVLRRISSELEARAGIAFPQLHNRSLSFRAVSEVGALKEESRAITDELFKAGESLQQEIRKREALEVASNEAETRHRSEMQAKQDAFNQMQLQLEQKNDEVSAQRDDLAHISKEMENLRSALSQIYGSTSWRVSAPVRWMRKSLAIFGHNSSSRSSER